MKGRATHTYARALMEYVKNVAAPRHPVRTCLSRGNLGRSQSHAALEAVELAAAVLASETTAAAEIICMWWAKYERGLLRLRPYLVPSRAPGDLAKRALRRRRLMPWGQMPPVLSTTHTMTRLPLLTSALALYELQNPDVGRPVTGEIE